MACLPRVAYVYLPWYNVYLSILFSKHSRSKNRNLSHEIHNEAIIIGLDLIAFPFICIRKLLENAMLLESLVRRRQSVICLPGESHADGLSNTEQVSRNNRYFDHMEGNRRRHSSLRLYVSTSISSWHIYQTYSECCHSTCLKTEKCLKIASNHSYECTSSCIV